MEPFPRVKMLLEEYLEFDFNAVDRFEYFHGEVFEICGESPEYALLGNRIGRLLGNQLDERSCLVFSSEVKIKVSNAAVSLRRCFGIVRTAGL